MFPGATMNYLPRVESMNRVAGAPLAPGYTVLLFDNIKSAGAVEYTFLVGVFDDSTQQPVYFVASEVNTTAATLGGGSHYLGLFDGQGHANCGSSDDWGDPKKFFAKALRIVKERFGAAPQ
jgi:hypothetical protein